MQVKTFEIRDSGTFIPVVAVKLTSDENASDRYLLRRAGLNQDASYNVLLHHLNSDYGYIDYYRWPGAPTIRTMHVAHKYIGENFDKLESGQVIDVQYILGETNEPKISEKHILY